MPQLPQFATSDCKFTQEPPQNFLPDAQRQTPAEQAALYHGEYGGQTTPQAPQLSLSELMSVQTPAQVVPGVGQTQAPAMHFSAPTQSWPQTPQLVSSD